jgi:hypothetical protein
MAIAFQSAVKTTGVTLASDPQDVTLAATIGAGNMVLVFIHGFNGSYTSIAVSDTLGNTYTRLPGQVINDPASALAFATVGNATNGGATTVKAHIGGGIGLDFILWVVQYSGVSAIGPTTQPEGGTAPPSTATGSVTIAEGGNVVVGAFIAADSNSGIAITNAVVTGVERGSQAFMDAGSHPMDSVVVDNTAASVSSVTVTETFSGGGGGAIPWVGALVELQAVGISSTVTATPASGPPGTAVAFTATAPIGGISPYTFSWTFGDGGTSTLQNPTHTYSTAGSFTAVLTINDSLLQSGTDKAPLVNIMSKTGGTLGNNSVGRRPLPHLSTPDRIENTSVNGGT